jgi:hypothetical protein
MVVMIFVVMVAIVVVVTLIIVGSVGAVLIAVGRVPFACRVRITPQIWDMQTVMIEQ